MADLFDDDDADLSVVQARNVAVLGYSSQGRAQALSLRDSGVDVRVGLMGSSRDWDDAQVEGLRVVTPYEACEEADLVVVLTPEPGQRTLYAEAIEPNLVDGDALLFGHGFNISFGYVKPPDGVDVIMVAPIGPGNLVRQEFEDGRGVPVLVAVEQDASGQAWDLTLSYARAIGGTRAGAIKTTFAEETATHLFGSQAVLCGGVSSLVQSGIEVLTEAGYQPEVAYFACLLELKQVVDLMYRAGIAQQRRLVGDVAEYGDYTSGPYLIDDSVKQRMRDVLTAVQDGSWAADFVADQDAGAPRLRYFRQRSESHPMEQTGREMRLLMSGVRAFDDGDADLG